MSKKKVKSTPKKAVSKPSKTAKSAKSKPQKNKSKVIPSKNKSLVSKKKPLANLKKSSKVSKKAKPAVKNKALAKASVKDSSQKKSGKIVNKKASSFKKQSSVNTKPVKTKKVSEIKKSVKKVVKEVQVKSNKQALTKSNSKDIKKPLVSFEKEPLKEKKAVVQEKKQEPKNEPVKTVLARTFIEKKKEDDKKSTIGKLVQEKVKPSANIDAPSIGTSYGNVTKAENRNIPEPKGRFELEYVVHSSASILYEFLTSPSGLSEWFCDDVNIRNGIYSFIWDGSVQMARLVKQVEDKSIRFQWTEKNDGSFFEFRIEKDDLTNDISLIVTDFADTPEEKASSKLLWDSQIEKLLQVLGSHF